MTPSSAFPIAPLSYDIHAFEQLDSTNAYLARLAQKGAPEGTVIFAQAQTQGRGRYGREWLSPKGNVYFSLLLRPKVALREVAQLSFVAALAIGDALSDMIPDSVELKYKWPNDILLNQKKVAGILLESSSSEGQDHPHWLMVGCGINSMHVPKEVAEKAVSIAQMGGDMVLETKLRDKILHHFDQRRTEWYNKGFAPIRDAWLEKAAFIDQDITVTTSEEHSYQGIMRGINEVGELVLELPDQRVRLISSGEVFFSENRK